MSDRNPASSRHTEPMQTHRPKLRRIKCCKVKIKDVKGLDKGFMADTPDAYVQVFAPQTLEERFETKVVLNNKNPVFNEEKIFTLTGDDSDVEIIVKENNVFMEGEHGRYAGKLLDTPNQIQINDTATLSMDVSCSMEEPQLREGGQLCSEEIQFCKARNKKICAALEKFLGKNILKSDDESKIPSIAVLGSGGGFRAMMGMCGAVKALSDTGLLDCVKYMAGVSGSTWYMSTLCSRPDWPKVNLEELNNHLKECVGKELWDTITCLETVWNCYQQNWNDESPWTFTDLFGHWVGETLIPHRMDFKWGDLKDKLRDGDCPLPMLACVRAEVDTPVEEFHEWLEISPYEVHMPKYATSLDLKYFGSEFYKGRVTEEKEELPLHYVMGICGSAFTALHKSFSEMSAKSHKLSGIGRRIEGDMSGTEPVHQSQSKWMEFGKSLLDKIGLNYLDDRSGRAAMVPNFLRQLSLERIDDVESAAFHSENKYMCLVDAGLAFNSPYPLVLRSGRMVDIILSFEFSDRGKDDNQPFEQLLLAKKWADQHKVTFPPIAVDQYKDKPVQEVYVFEDEKDPHCPIIVHFVLVNNHFRSQYSENGSAQTPEEKEFADFNIFNDGIYDSMNFEYTAEQFNRISKLMEFNVHHCLEKVKESILKCVKRRET